MAGAPLGNKNGSTGYQARHALELALRHYPEIPEVIGSVRTLILLWQPILRRAMEDGDLSAMKEINDRLDGKPAQSITTDVTIRETDPDKRKSRIKELLSKTST
tara:strand:- start:3253 stop:3564 length:312 start_codon:yes stop_codon:yes gene_type:complete